MIVAKTIISTTLQKISNLTTETANSLSAITSSHLRITTILSAVMLLQMEIWPIQGVLATCGAAQVIRRNLHSIITKDCHSVKPRIRHIWVVALLTSTCMRETSRVAVSITKDIWHPHRRIHSSSSNSSLNIMVITKMSKIVEETWAVSRLPRIQSPIISITLGAAILRTPPNSTSSILHSSSQAPPLSNPSSPTRRCTIITSHLFSRSNNCHQPTSRLNSSAKWSR